MRAREREEHIHREATEQWQKNFNQEARPLALKWEAEFNKYYNMKKSKLATLDDEGKEARRLQLVIEGRFKAWMARGRKLAELLYEQADSGSSTTQLMDAVDKMHDQD